MQQEEDRIIIIRRGEEGYNVFLFRARNKIGTVNISNETMVSRPIKGTRNLLEIKAKHNVKLMKMEH